MLDGYQIHHGDSNQECDIELVLGTSSWKRWIPETIAECNSLKCMDCMESLERCCTSDRSHNNCPYRDGLPKTIEKQSYIDEFIKI